MKKEYKERTDWEIRFKSAVLAASTIASLKQLHPTHQRQLLSICVWKATEARPFNKHRTRFMSLESLKADKNDLIHEHVIERKHLVTEMINSPDKVEEILQQAVACVVTKDEHDRLAKAKGFGWERYREAKIKWKDLVDGSEHE